MKTVKFLSGLLLVFLAFVKQERLYVATNYQKPKRNRSQIYKQQLIVWLYLQLYWGVSSRWFHLSLYYENHTFAFADWY